MHLFIDCFDVIRARVMAEKDPIAAMKARWSYIQPYLFPFLHEEVDPLTAKLEQLIYVLDTIGLEAYVRAEVGGRGRPREDRRAIARAFVAKAVLGLPTTRALIERLTVDAAHLRMGKARRNSFRAHVFPGLPGIRR